ncbi:MAG TPA: DUF2809 domain-containing protein [Oscillatoriales cyanobacterium M59_W2019_021]|nr:MAG: DUF2809 domain-containing protein [Cyanobacteria bacterium J055]HIK31027.1 DUF2809 domain-containing protein [Oscillatoriales cyanobacterium M4454_W2019_049]HIK50449.1 DUF2809 domain-containing protein [Oscillatoriales cyanobacterium M59_W2019_021]
MRSPLSPKPRWVKYRVILAIAIAIIVPLGYVIRFTPIPGWEWLSDFLGSVAYEIFWILLVAFGFPRWYPAWVAVAVCLATCGLEFLQLWQPPFLPALRSTLPGRLVLGNTFVWTDFIAYFVGSFAGWGVLRSLSHVFGRSTRG